MAFELANLKHAEGLQEGQFTVGERTDLDDAERIHEDDSDGQRATDTIGEAWTKYTGNQPPYGLRDPARNERRVLFECQVASVATFGLP